MQKETGTNEQTNTILQTPMTFSQGSERKYEMKTKRVLINKERNRYKKEEDVETRRI